MRFRAINRAIALLGGYFWLPCACCGQKFGGHEWGFDDGNAIAGQGICPDCTAAGKGDRPRQRLMEAALAAGFHAFAKAENGDPENAAYRDDVTGLLRQALPAYLEEAEREAKTGVKGPV